MKSSYFFSVVVFEEKFYGQYARARIKCFFKKILFLILSKKLSFLAETIFLLFGFVLRAKKEFLTGEVKLVKFSPVSVTFRIHFVSVKKSSCL